MALQFWSANFSNTTRGPRCIRAAGPAPSANPHFSRPRGKCARSADPASPDRGSPKAFGGRPCPERAFGATGELLIRPGPDEKFRLSLPSSANQFLLSPYDILVGCTTPLIFTVKHLSELFKIRNRRLIKISPALFIRAFRLKSPGTTRFDDANFAL